MVGKTHLLYLLFGISLAVGRGYSQAGLGDTMNISVHQADSLFLAKNLALLAEKYNVEATRALVIQSRLWDNPNITLNQNVVNPGYKAMGAQKWFDMSDKGETSAQIQQLFLLAGKRNKRVNLSQLVADREEQNYFDMLRTLKYSLRSGFYNICYLQNIVKVYDKEINSLSKIVEVFEGQMEKGYASKKDVLRLKASLMSLESEKVGYQTQLIGAEADFNVLMHSSAVYYVPQLDSQAIAKMTTDSLKLQPLIDTAFACRFDLKMAQADYKSSQVNLSYQKALAVPDLTLIAGWDRNGGYFKNYNFVGLQMDLPFFNRNQGNIKSARFNVESSKLKLQSAEDQVKSDVLQAYTTLLETNKLYKKFDAKFVTDLETLNQEIIKNYEKRNISLLEFLDFYDAYKENMVQLNTLQNNRINSFENLNYSVGKEIVK